MATIEIVTRVLPGNRIEVVNPQLPVGEEVKLKIDTQRSSQSSQQDLLKFLDSLPPSSRTAEEWQTFDRQLREERDAWDR